MKTLFPYNWQCIAVCPVLRKMPDSAESDIPFENLALIYPQVQFASSRNTEAGTAEILFIDDSDIDSGMLDALFSNHLHPLDNIFAILRDYLSWRSSFVGKDDVNLNPDYLQFGGEQLPEYFDLTLVEQLLKQLTVAYPAGVDWQDPTARSNYCYYCDKDLHNADTSEYHMMKNEYGKNDRKVCNDCFRRLLTDKKQMMPLYDQVKQNLCSDYGIELPASIKVKFESAAKIRKSSSKKRRFRIIGLASSNNTVWAEKDSTPEHIMEILAHELTHIWQYNNLPVSKMSTEAMEGHASYVEMDYMRNHDYPGRATRLQNDYHRRDDDYGRGFVKLEAAINEREDKNPFHYMKETYQ